MTLFFTVLGAVVLGTFSSNMALFWLIGQMAKRQEEKQKEELEKLQKDFLEARQKEIERMKRYAKMES